MRPLLLLALTCPAMAMEPDDSWPPPEGERAREIYDDLGNLSFPISINELAQQYFDQGFRLLSAFDFRRAVLAFRAAEAEVESRCVLCHWGEAMALGPNLNSFDEPRLLASIPSAFQKAQAAVDLLERELPRANRIERGLVYALKQRYLPTAAEYVMNESKLTHSYALEMERLLADVKTTDANYANVAALTADALMNTCPWDYWVPDPGNGNLQLRPAAGKAMKILKSALTLSPRHPFCIHLLVHITEASQDPHLLQQVRPMAKTLPQLMPGAPHLIHMSFHTLMHTGDFHVADEDNTWATLMPRQIYPMHNLDTLSWVCRIQGRSLCSLDAAKSLEHRALHLVGSGTFETGFPPARFAAVWPLTLLAFGRYRRIWDAEPPTQCREEPFLAGIWHFARGAAAAHLGLRGKADEELMRLRRKRAEVVEEMQQSAGLAWKNFNGSKAWAVYPAAQLLALAEQELLGQLGELKAWRRAAAMEAALPYDEPPSWYLPVANRLGEALAEAGELEEASEVYSNTLSRLPKNGWAMMGRWQLCLRRWGQENSTCHELHRNFSKAWRYADVNLKNSAEVQGPTGPTSSSPSSPSFLWLSWSPSTLQAMVPWLFVASSMAFLVPILRRPSRSCGCYYRLESS